MKYNWLWVPWGQGHCFINSLEFPVTVVYKLYKVGLNQVCEIQLQHFFFFKLTWNCYLITTLILLLLEVMLRASAWSVENLAFPSGQSFNGMEGYFLFSHLQKASLLFSSEIIRYSMYSHFPSFFFFKCLNIELFE